MRKYLNSMSKIGFVVIVMAGLSLSSCSEDLINPDTSAMPPKNLIKTPPQKD